MNRMRWTPENDARLTRLWADGMQGRDIGEALGGCSEDAVRARAEKLRLPRRKAPDWTADEDATLLRLRREKIPYGEIAQRLGRSLFACRVRHQTLTMRKAVKSADEAPPPMQRLNAHTSALVDRTTARAAAMHKAGMALEAAIITAERDAGGLVKLDPRAVKLAMEGGA